MTHRPAPPYSLNPDTGIWKRDNYGGTSYTDGDAEEQALLHIVQSAADVSLFSPDLGRACEDWVRSYHFSPARANILRPFESALSSAHVLEIGAGCGAITRYLGENARQVTAVEGSLQRARIARARTRDIETVSVVADNFYAFESTELFDVVTSIGVFEYANVYADEGQDGATAFLQKAHGLLKDDGYLIIAIENKLGLKYFSGTPEDHLWKEMYGVEGRYQSNEPVTYGRVEIEARLKSAGFRLVQTHAVLPDYKFPSTIITGQGAKLASQLSGDLAAQASLRDRQGTNTPLFAQELVWKSIADNELLIDFANSHLIVAAKTSLPAAWDSRLLAEHYSTERKKIYAKVTQFVAQDDQGGIDIRVRKMVEGDAPPNDPPIHFHPTSVSHYIEGELLATALRRITATDGWTVDTFSSLFNDYLYQISGLDRSQLKVSTPISGKYIDATPANIITGKDGTIHFFDQEWTWPADIPLGWMAFRSLLIFFQSASIHAKPADGIEYTRRTFMMNVFQRFDVDSTPDHLDEYAAMEAGLQAVVQERPHTAFLNWWADSPLNCEHSGDRLYRLNTAYAREQAQTQALTHERNELTQLFSTSQEQLHRLTEQHLIQTRVGRAVAKKYEDSRRDIEILQGSLGVSVPVQNRLAEPVAAAPSPAQAPPSVPPAPAVQNLTPRVAAKLLVSHTKTRLTPSVVVRRRRDAMIRGSGLFDSAYYLQENPDVAQAGASPIDHYLDHGWKEGRNPSASFSSAMYLEHNPDVLRMGMNPLLHFVQHGQREGRVVHPVPAPTAPLEHIRHIDSRLSLAFTTPHPPELSPGSTLGRARICLAMTGDRASSVRTYIECSDASEDKQTHATPSPTERTLSGVSLSALLPELLSSLDGEPSTGWMIELDRSQAAQSMASDGLSIAQAVHPQLHKLAGEGIEFVSLATSTRLDGSDLLSAEAKDTLRSVLADDLRVALSGADAELPVLHDGFWISPALLARFKATQGVLLASAGISTFRSADTAFFALQMLFLAVCKKSQGRAIRLSAADEVTCSPDYQGPLDFRDSIAHPSVKLLAYYLPQFHPTPENDEWHGKGFTEWFKTRAANPQFPDHYQQHTPSADIGFYDLEDIGVLQKQSEMLAKAGMHGLIFYHYWFGGKLILERPAQMLLAHPEVPINFCFCWANENWTRTWDGNEKEILLAQDYSVEDAIGFIRYLIPFFRDPRHVKIDGRPVLFIYRPASIPAIQEYIDAWREECLAAGIAAPYLVSTLTRGATDPRHYHFDAAVERPLHDWTDGGVKERRHELGTNDDFEGSVLDYSDVAAFYCRQDSQKDYAYFRSLVPVWDNTARYQERGLLLHNFRLPVFQNWLTTLIEDAEVRLPEDRRFVVVNAWNEWAEGAHLEPDLRYGYGYLNAVGRAMSRLPSDGLPDTSLTDLRTVVKIELSDAVRAALSGSPGFGEQVSRCLRDADIPGFVETVADPLDAALLMGLGFPGIRTQGEAEQVQLRLRWERPVIFQGDFLAHLMVDAATHPHAVSHAYTVNDAGFSGTLAEGSHTVQGAPAATCGPAESSAAHSVRLCVQARCYLAGIGSVAAPAHINTIIRFHALGEEVALTDALYCLAAQRDVVVHPLLMGQDLSDDQTVRIQKLLDQLPLPASSQSRIVRFASSQDAPDLRSQLLAEGLKHADQAYAAFLDFDDTLYNDAYVNMIGRLQKTGKAVSFGRLHSASFDGVRRIAKRRTPMFLQRHRFDQFFDDNFIPLHSYVMDMKQVDVEGLIYFDHMKFMEDYFIALQLLNADNSDWDALHHPTFVGDYNFRVSGTPNTLALITDDQKNQVLSDPHYQLCDLRIQWMRKQVQTRRERLTDKPSVAQP